MTTADKLRFAKAQLRLHGWIRNSYGNKARGFCLVGALFAACEEARVPFGDAYDALYRACDDAPVRFNDRVAGSVDDVNAKIDEAIALVEKEEIP